MLFRSPVHLQLKDKSLPINYTLKEYDEPAQRYCPVGVYEVQKDKDETDDMREAPSLTVIPDLIKAGLNISVYDPEGQNEASKLITDVEWKKSAYEVADNSNCLVILTDWQEFKEIDLKKLYDSMQRPLIYDFRNIYDPDIMKELGFEYFSVGRG